MRSNILNHVEESYFSLVYEKKVIGCMDLETVFKQKEHG